MYKINALSKEEYFRIADLGDYNESNVLTLASNKGCTAKAIANK